MMPRRPRLPTLEEMEAQAAVMPDGPEKEALLQRVRALRANLPRLPGSAIRPELAD